MVDFQVCHRLFEGFPKLGGIHGSDLGLKNDFRAVKLWKDPPQLHFTATVAAGRFDMVDAQF